MDNQFISPSCPTNVDINDGINAKAEKHKRIATNDEIRYIDLDESTLKRHEEITLEGSKSNVDYVIDAGVENNKCTKFAEKVI